MNGIYQVRGGWDTFTQTDGFDRLKKRVEFLNSQGERVISILEYTGDFVLLTELDRPAP